MTNPHTPNDVDRMLRQYRLKPAPARLASEAYPAPARGSRMIPFFMAALAAVALAGVLYLNQRPATDTPSDPVEHVLSDPTTPLSPARNTHAPRETAPDHPTAEEDDRVPLKTARLAGVVGAVAILETAQGLKSYVTGDSVVGLKILEVKKDRVILDKAELNLEKSSAPLLPTDPAIKTSPALQKKVVDVLLAGGSREPYDSFLKLLSLSREKDSDANAVAAAMFETALATLPGDIADVARIYSYGAMLAFPENSNATLREPVWTNRALEFHYLGELLLKSESHRAFIVDPILQAWSTASTDEQRYGKMDNIFSHALDKIEGGTLNEKLEWTWIVALGGVYGPDGGFCLVSPRYCGEAVYLPYASFPWRVQSIQPVPEQKQVTVTLVNLYDNTTLYLHENEALTVSENRKYTVRYRDGSLRRVNSVLSQDLIDVVSEQKEISELRLGDTFLWREGGSKYPGIRLTQEQYKQKKDVTQKQIRRWFTGNGLIR